ICESYFRDVIEIQQIKDGSLAYQLTRLNKMGELIRNRIIKRMNAKRLEVNADWRAILNTTLDTGQNGNYSEDEDKARTEKIEALKELAESRFSVLIGSAGTGKTTLLSILSKQDEIREGGVLFLAPTGKARVRMDEVAKELRIPAYTIAQFLNGLDRFDGKNQTYHLSESRREESYETIILDEASMLTEEMLAALIDGIKGFKRLILVGDDRQLPPIGSGRPFVDIINYLKPENIENCFPKVNKGYAELTVSRRHIGENRKDIQFANLFNGSPQTPGEDSIFGELQKNENLPNLRLINWENENDFERIFKDTIVEELGLESIDDYKNFNKSLGSFDGSFFNSSSQAVYFKSMPAVNKINDWQLLSPLRGKAIGTKSLNRFIHQIFRQGKINEANRYDSKIPKPKGVERIVYGDKVINLINHRRDLPDYCNPPDGLNYIANGEIGIAVGKYAGKKKGKPMQLEVEYSSQKGFVYPFYERDFKEESDPTLELAYAITIHKSQGSEFNKVFLVIPNPCFLLSRELLYTALTRQTDKVILFYQGDFYDLNKYSSSFYSDTLQRYTNLFASPDMREVEGKFLEKNLIQMASNGCLLRSKSELLIYQRLIDKGLDPSYEKPLIVDKEMKLPDFTIIDDDLGEIYYWEHCGMMHNRQYVNRWEEKKKWYSKNGIHMLEEGGGPNGTLLVSYDKPVEVEGKLIGSISVIEIDKLIKEAFSI
ncbi:ATP-dependent RecD-like DNA helicase, partial [Bacteroidota bacterium]